MDITCEAFFASVDALLHDELSEADALNVRNHLGVCKRCLPVLLAEVKFRSLILSASGETSVLPASLSGLPEFQSLFSPALPQDAASNNLQKQGLPPVGRESSTRFPKLMALLKRKLSWPGAFQDRR